MTSFEATNFVFNLTDENNSFSVGIPGRWIIPNYLEDGIFDNLKNLLSLRTQIDIELHVHEVRKRSDKIKFGDKEYKLSDFRTSKKEIIEDLKSANYHDLEELIYRREQSYDEIMNVLDTKFYLSQIRGYTLGTRIHEISDINKTLEFLLSDFVKVIITIDDIRLGSNLNNNQTLIFTKKYFFNRILGHIQSHSRPLNDIEGSIQLIPGSYKSDKPIKTTSVDKVHLECDCINGNIVNGIREPILYSFALSSPPGHKI